MFYHHLKNELWKLFGKKRTYIGFGAFLLAQNAMLLAFRFTRWQSDMERMLAGNGYLAQDFVSALTVVGRHAHSPGHAVNAALCRARRR